MVTAIQSLSCLPAMPPPDIDQRLSLAVFELDSERPSVELSLPFAEQIRRALIRNRVDTSHSEAITGKTVAGVPLQGHEHAHYFATDEDGDGCLDHVTIYCRRGFDEADVEALGSLRTIYRRGNAPDVRMILIGLGGVELFVKSGSRRSKLAASMAHPLPQVVLTGPSVEAGGAMAHPLPQVVLTEQSAEAGGAMAHPLPQAVLTGPPSEAGSAMTHPLPQVVLTGPSEAGNAMTHPLPQVVLTSRQWRSVTPFSLPRFPNRGGGKPPRPRDLPEAQLTQELVARGLPLPISIKRIEGYQPKARPIVRWLEFHTQRFKGTQGKGVAGFEIEFAEPVAGPIAVGFGCHFGLGLFMPC